MKNDTFRNVFGRRWPFVVDPAKKPTDNSPAGKRPLQTILATVSRHAFYDIFSNLKFSSRVWVREVFGFGQAHRHR